jgi:hypothetical protein
VNPIDIVVDPIGRVSGRLGHPTCSGRSPGFMDTPVPTRRSDGRSERRIPKRLAAELSRADESVPKEMTFTENLSPRGVRVTTAQRWQPGTRALVTFLRDGIRSQGRIVYCERVESGRFALGLELPWQVQRWQMLR